MFADKKGLECAGRGGGLDDGRAGNARWQQQQHLFAKAMRKPTMRWLGALLTPAHPAAPYHTGGGRIHKHSYTLHIMYVLNIKDGPLRVYSYFHANIHA